MAKRSELEKHLKRAGFTFEGYGGRHPFWVKGTTRIMTPTSRLMSENTYKWILVQIRKAK